MVLGIDSFREKFKDYTEYYTIIGGTACDILLTEADLPFRATKDIDMILIMEDNFPEFAIGKNSLVSTRYILFIRNNMIYYSE